MTYKKILILLSIFNFYLKSYSQVIPDSISISKHTYVLDTFPDIEKVFKAEKIIITNKRKITKLLREFKKPLEKNEVLGYFGIDTVYISKNLDKLIKLHKGYYKDKIAWNLKQREWASNTLLDIENYKQELDDLFSVGCCYTMNSHYKTEYKISIFDEGREIEHFNSKKNSWGYYFPYENKSGKFIYNYKIDQYLHKLFETPSKIREPMYRKKLLSYLVNEILHSNINKLYKLSAYSYEKEASDLSSVFSIISSEQVLGRGRYLWNDTKTIKFILKNNEMLDNVYIHFYATDEGQGLYSNDSLKQDYKTILSKIQSITFIKEYLRQDPTAILDILYFDNKPINNYKIESFNKNSNEWKKHDNWLASMKRYEDSETKPDFDIEKSIKVSESVNCGCNLRYDNKFLQESIFFEITSERNNSSLWFLIPDGTLLLYHVQGYNPNLVEVIDNKLVDLLNGKRLPWACLLFDKNGQVITK